METISDFLKASIIFIIRIYRYAISGLLGQCCRFEPSCSNYAIEAVKHHGCLKGLGLSFLRIIKCHPWHAGGDDPLIK